MDWTSASHGRSTAADHREPRVATPVRSNSRHRIRRGAQGLSLGFVLLRVESLVEEGKL